MGEPWPDETAARAAVVALCEDRFNDLFGCPVPPGWSAAWLTTYRRLCRVEIKARDVARDFNRLSLAAARANTRAFLREHRERRFWTPLLVELDAYMRFGEKTEPFCLDRTTGLRFLPRNASDLDVIKNGFVQCVVPEGIRIKDREGNLRTIAGDFDDTSIQVGVKHDRAGGIGALPDFRNFIAFVIHRFEGLPCAAPPASPAPAMTWCSRPSSSGLVYLSDRELAVIAIVMDAKALRVSPLDLADGTPPGRLLDVFRRKVSDVRRRFGYLETAHPELTGKERQKWIREHMDRPEGVRPLLRWPSATAGDKI